MDQLAGAEGPCAQQSNKRSEKQSCTQGRGKGVKGGKAGAHVTTEGVIHTSLELHGASEARIRGNECQVNAALLWTLENYLHQHKGCVVS